MSAPRAEARRLPLLSRPGDSALASWTTVPLLAVILALAALIVPAASPVLTSTVTLGLVGVVAVVGLQSFVGLSGVFSFGQVGFMAIGAYLTANLTIPVATKQVLFPTMPMVQLDPVLAVLIAGAGAGLVAFVFGLPLMPLSGLVASLGTFAFLNIVHSLALNLSAVTGGSTGLSNVPKAIAPWSALIWAIAAVAVGWLYQRSRWGLQLQATRDDPVAAQAAGISVFRQRLIGFTVSGFLSGVAGGMYALSSGSFSPASFFLVATLGYIAMLVVGGRMTVSGAVLGVVLLGVLEQLLRGLEKLVGLPGLQQLGFAIALVLVLILRPIGLLGQHELIVPLRRRIGARR